MFFQQIEAQKEHSYANLRRDTVVSEYEQIQVTPPTPQQSRKANTRSLRENVCSY